MVKIQEISSDKNIIKNEKIDFFKCYLVGNKIMVSVGIFGDTIINNNEILIKFPFVAKTSYRLQIKSSSLLAYIDEGNNCFKVETYNNIKIESYSVLNFEFYI